MKRCALLLLASLIAGVSFQSIAQTVEPGAGKQTGYVLVEISAPPNEASGVVNEAQQRVLRSSR